MAGLQDILFSYSFRSNQSNIDYYSDMAKIYDEKAVQYNKDAYDKYQTARKMYDGNFQDYKSASRYSSTDVIESLINETYETAKSIAEAVKSANNLIQFYEDKLTERNLRPATLADTHLSTLNTYTGKTNTHLLNLLSIKRTLQTDKEAITNAEGDLKEMDQNNPLDMSAAEAAVKEKEDSLAKLKAGTDPLDIQSAERSVAEKTESLAKLKAGTDPLDIQAQELTIKQRQNALLDAKEKLADYFVHAPFDGVVAAIDIKKGDPISASTVIATFITKQRVAEVTLNEVDVARAEIGQKATLTFDAVPDLSITGEVAGIDTIGTVSQGVVSYTVRITFDTQDERVKPGMSVSANIIIEAKSDVLLVPNSAIKSQGSGQYVEVAGGQVEQARVVSQTGVILPQPPRRQTVEIGISNDESTEITTGLKEGDRVITQAITSKSSAASTSSSQNRGFDAGMMRMMR
jgi:RND family efflux transporter MFP subunit